MSGSVSVVKWRASPTVGKLREMHSTVQVSLVRNSLSASLVTDDLPSFKGLTRFGAARKLQDD